MTKEYCNEIGQVVFFDQKKGWGFINILKGTNEYEDKRIFTHFSSINCQNGFKKLFPGEYVSLNVVINEDEQDEKKKLQSQNVTGLFGNLLLIDNENHNYKIYKKFDNEN